SRNPLIDFHEIIVRTDDSTLAVYDNYVRKVIGAELINNILNFCLRTHSLFRFRLFTVVNTFEIIAKKFHSAGDIVLKAFFQVFGKLPGKKCSDELDSKYQQENINNNEF